MADSPAGRVPGWAIIPAALGALLVLVPVVSMAARVDWPGLPALLTSESSVTALLLSLRTALASTFICFVLGVPMALVLARGHIRGMRWLRALVLLPLVLPPVVGGLALLAAFGRTGLVGQYLEAGGLRIAFTTVAVILAQVFVSLPFLVVGVEGALRSVGTDYEKVASTHGASPTRTLVKVTLPLVAPGLVSGTVLAFARALGEFGATLTFAGSLQGTTRTLPLEIYLQREVDPDQALALSLLLIVVALAVVALVHNNGDLSVPRRRRAPRPRDSSVADAPVSLPSPPGALRWRGSLDARGHATQLVVEPGHTVAVIGANGAGKSTLLGLLAGLLQPDEGRLTIGDAVLTDSDTSIAVPPHRRRVVLLGQRPLLFPHLDVQGNAEFGPRAIGKDDPAALARDALRSAGALEWAAEPSTALSGGEAARVALARALACQPLALLLDEPFAALDVASAPAARAAVSAALRQTQCPTVLVTHDLLDVLALADHVVVLDRGHVVESGTVTDTLTAPRSSFAAELAGVNVLHGVLQSEGLLTVQGDVAVSGRHKTGAPVGAPAFAVFSPSSVAIFLEPPHGSPRNVWPVTVTSLTDQGGTIRVRLTVTDGPRLGADLTAAAVAELGLRAGEEVWAVVKATEVALHEAKTEGISPQPPTTAPAP